ncbi:hypothetical protein FVD41_10370 [Bacillus amyloliquefaciens]|nr:hypothetical protein FVD42_10435 [Bacillus amyloliquefaciens]TXK30605.1 hypothetical protein FVD41_10370 [Bacillus amyloliquefaciens]
MEDAYLSLMSQGWSLHQIDESDYLFYIRLLERQEMLDDPVEKKKRERATLKTVPIDHVF